MTNIEKHVAAAVASGDYAITEEGLLINRGIKVVGRYFDYLNGVPVSSDPNLVPDEGLLFILNVALGATSKVAGFYLAPFSGGTNPAAGWTAATFTVTASEITSNSEGFSNATRPAWTPATAAAGKITNAASLAVFNVVATAPLIVRGAGLVTSNTRGGTGGTLVSASKFAVERTLYGGDTWELGYEVSLLDS